MADPTASPPRRLIPILAAWSCWLIGGHALIVPAVVSYALARLCVWEGAGNVLGSAPGLKLAAMFGISWASSLAFFLAGLSYHRARWGRGAWQVASALGLALATVALFAIG